MLGALQALKWQIGTALAAAAAITLGVTLLVTKIENRSLTKHNERLSKELTTARLNSATLEAAIADQNAKIEQQGRMAAERLARSEAALATATVARRDAERRASTMLKTPPKGETLDARVRDVDARIMEALR